MARSDRSQISGDPPLLKGSQVCLVVKVGIPRDLVWLAPEVSADGIDEWNTHFTTPSDVASTATIIEDAIAAGETFPSE